MRKADTFFTRPVFPLGKWLSKDGPLGYLLISPAFLFLLLFEGYPLIYALYLSLTDKHLGAQAEFIGLQNFIVLSQTSLFWKTVANSLIYTVGALTLKFLGGLALALLLNRKFVGRRYVQAAMLLPWIIPTVFSTLSWWWMLDPAFSIINVVLKDLGLIKSNIPFLVKPTWAMVSLILVNVWRGVPFFAITSLAAIQTVPEAIIDASKIDGANSWQRFWKVIFPQILPVVTIVVLISTIGTIADFELPFLLTRGGPGDATYVFGIMAFNYSIGNGLLGLGAAVSLTMFPILAILVVWTLLELRRRE